MASPLPRKESKMTKTDKADMSCARVKQYTASDVSKAERHNERKNETYENMNVIVERIPLMCISKSRLPRPIWNS